MPRTFAFLAATLLFLATVGHALDPAASSTKAGPRVEVAFSGGHETEPRDRGRPVNLVAGALRVPSDVFREAFSHVQPAPAGQEPDRAQVQQNKAALMAALGQYGVTNERLDTVSNRYRYVRSRGELWPTKEAKAYAVVESGSVKSIVVTDGGYGYSSLPQITIPGVKQIPATLELRFNADFEKNGAISITLEPTAKP